MKEISLIHFVHGNRNDFVNLIMTFPASIVSLCTIDKNLTLYVYIRTFYKTLQKSSPRLFSGIFSPALNYYVPVTLASSQFPLEALTGQFLTENKIASVLDFCDFFLMPYIFM